MLKNILTGFLLLVLVNGRAQETINKNTAGSIAGKVLDSVTANPIEYATITLIRVGSKKPLNGTVTNNKGQYSLTDVDPGAYKILVESIGYLPNSSNYITVNKNYVFINTPDSCVMPLEANRHSLTDILWFINLIFLIILII